MEKIKNENSKKALLVIDLQIDTIDENGKLTIEKSQTKNLITAVNDVIDDFYEKNYTIIYIRHIFKKDDENNKYRNYACIEGTKGVEIDPRIKIVSENIFEKFDASALSNDKLNDYLLEKQINELFLCGVMAEHCIKETALDAKRKKFNVNYISNAVGALNVKDIENVKMELKVNGINIIE